MTQNGQLFNNYWLMENMLLFNPMLKKSTTIINKHLSTGIHIPHSTTVWDIIWVFSDEVLSILYSQEYFRFSPIHSWYIHWVIYLSPYTSRYIHWVFFCQPVYHKIFTESFICQPIHHKTSNKYLSANHYIMKISLSTYLLTNMKPKYQLSIYLLTNI